MTALHGRMELDEIKARMAARGLRQVDLAKAIGIDQPKVSKSLTGERQFKVREMDILRELLRDTGSEFTPRPIPIIGQVAAGRWKQAIQQPAGFLPQPDPSIPPKVFALRVSGDSMNLHVDDGGTVIVDPEDRALYPGRFYIILDADGEATFKQFAADPARLAPCSTNPVHQDIMIGSGESFQIVGRVIWRGARM